MKPSVFIQFLIVSIFFLFCSHSTWAQVSTYNFAQASGTYTPITGGNILGGNTIDDESFSGLPIGFPFMYNGAVYTSFAINTNGWIALGTGLIAGSYSVISTGTNNNAIAALNYDLQGRINEGELSYKVIGTAPNRSLVVQWKNFNSYQNTVYNDVLNFQIRLNETSNTIDVVYGNITKDNTLRTPQVGLRGGSAADFSNRLIVDGSQTWPTSIAGSANTDVCGFSQTLFPPGGLTYTWTPGTPPTAPSALTFTAITVSGMTLNWVDNSVNETNWILMRSTDNINFIPVTTIASGTTATVGTTVNYVASGLTAGTLYYWRVYAASGGATSTPLINQASTLAGTLCGTYSIGPTGTYASLTSAFSALSTNGAACPVVFELQAAYLSTVETFPVTPPSVSNAAQTITIRPQLGASNLSITSSATQTIDFNGSANVVFDGRPGGLGTIRQLTIANTTTTGNAIRFLNDATNCGLNYINVRGVTTGSATNGVIAMGTVLTQGNNNCFISNSDVTSGSTSAQILIYAANPSIFIANKNFTISNCSLYNYTSATGATAAISISGSFINTTINNNSIYQTATRTFTAGTLHNGILINSNNVYSGGYTITGNHIGGSAPLSGGTAWTDAGAVSTRFIAINMIAGPVGECSIQSNTIRNFNFSTSNGSSSGTGIWCGMNLASSGSNLALYKVGNIAANTIGSTTAANAIVTSSSTPGGLVVGINQSSSANGHIISNNLVGGITANTTGATISSSVIGIQSSNGVCTINNNTVGSTTVALSISNSTNTSSTNGYVRGINYTSPLGATGSINNNTISNLHNAYAGTGTNSQTIGIYLSGNSIPPVKNNSITKLSNASPQAGTGSFASVIGIAQTGTAGATRIEISQNTIQELVNTSNLGNVSVTGIHASGSTTQLNIVNANTVKYLYSNSTGSAVINGIYLASGGQRVYNNMVILGNLNGTNLTNAHEYNGIIKISNAQCGIFFNSVLISGSNVGAGTMNTYALRITTNAATADSVYSNILANTRSNGASGGSHYSISLNNLNTFHADANDYYGNGIGYKMGIIGAQDYINFNVWYVTLSPQDNNSFNVNPNFVSNTNLLINGLAQSALESRAYPIDGITTDIQNEIRPGPTAINGGGTTYDIGADEFDGIPVSVDLALLNFVNPNKLNCKTGSEEVSVRLKNVSLQTINFAINPVVIDCSVSGPNPQTFPSVNITSGLVAAGASIQVTITSNYNMLPLGTYNFTATVSSLLDVITSNNTISSHIVNHVASTINGPTFNVCANTTHTITANGQALSAAVNWLYTTDSTANGWTPILGVTDSILLTTPSDTTYYKAITCNDTSATFVLNAISVDSPTVASASRCGIGPVSLIASNPLNTMWFDAPTGGNLLAISDTFTTTVNSDTVFYAVNGNNLPDTLTTTYAGGNGSQANMFSVTATQQLTINQIDMHLGSVTPSNVSIYYRPNDYTGVAGSTTSSAGWILLGTANNVIGAGAGLPTPIPIQFSVTIPQGQTYSFHTAVTSGSGVTYTNGTTVGNVYASDPYLQIREGHGGTLFSCTISPRIFNGSIHYLGGCLSARTAVPVTVIPAPSVQITKDSIICNGSSSTLTVSSTNPNYQYTWQPAASLSVDTGLTTVATPAFATQYTLHAMDSSSGCVLDSIFKIKVENMPAILASISPDTICNGAITQLNATVNSIYTIGTGNVQNTSTSYPAPYGNFYFGSKHQFLVLASELQAAGFVSGAISDIAFDVASSDGVGLNNFEIQIGSTNISNLSNTLIGSLTPVFATALYVPTAGENRHTLSTPFYWDGISNLVIQTCFNNTSFVSNCVFNQSNTAFTSCAAYTADQLSVCANTVANNLFNMRPNMKLYRSGTYNYTWSPALNVADPNADSTSATPNTSTTYTITVVNAQLGCSSTTTQSVVVNNLPTVTATALPATSICLGDTLTLQGNGSGSLTYSWNGNTTASADTVLVPLTSDTYTVQGLDANGCSATATLSIVVNNVPLVNASLTPSVACVNSAVYATANGANTYVWTNGLVNDQAFIATSSNTYVVTGIDSNGCQANDTVSLVSNAVSGQLALATAANTSSLAGTDSMQQIQTDGLNATYYDAACNIIADIDQSVNGNLNDTNTVFVHVENAPLILANKPYCARWFNISSSQPAPATIKLYCTQADFDSYNVYALGNSWKRLPQNAGDVAGMANILVDAYSSGTIGSGTPTTLSPTATWDATYNYWVLSFSASNGAALVIHSDPIVRLALKAFLSGPYNATSGLMRDSLRAKSYIPLSEPYSAAPYTTQFVHVNGGGGETTTNAVLSVSGNDAIVDWIFVQLRSKNDSTLVVATQSALLQRDGDIVNATDGISPISFKVPADSYFISIKHRNHLGIMTLNKYALSESVSSIDFTTGTPLYVRAAPNDNPTPLTGPTRIQSGVRTLYAGNNNLLGLPRQIVRYNGVSNDRISLLSYAGPTNVLSGYSIFDLDLNGSVRYNNTGNDRLVLLQNCAGINGVTHQQLPE